MRELLHRLRAAQSGISNSLTAAGRTAVGALWTSPIGRRIQEQLTDWPTKLDERIDLAGTEPVESGDFPDSGELVVYVHGFLGQGRFDSISASGAHQAAAFRQALSDEFEERPGPPPAVVVGRWNSSTSWPRAKRGADAAGARLVSWIESASRQYDSLTLVGHSLGARVVLVALNELTEATVDSVALLGAAVAPDAVCHEYRAGIESSVEGRVYNYHSENDRVVCRFYRIGEIHPGLGCRGSDCSGGLFSAAGSLPVNYTDVDVSGRVFDHLAYYKPPEYGSGGSCVPLFVAKQLGEA